MAFNINNLVRWSAVPVDAGTNPNPMNPPPPLPTWWGYKTTEDNIAAVSANNYFRYYADFFASSLYAKVIRVGDMIYCVCTDGVVQLTVLTVDPITTTPVVVAANSVNTAAIQNGAVTTPKIADANVTLAKLAAGITPSHIIKFANQVTTVGGAAAEAFAVAGAVAATDRAFVQVVDNGAANVTVLQAVVTANTLTVTFSADPGNDTVINYQIIRAAA